MSCRKVWIKLSIQRTEDGKKMIYRCIGGQYRRQECPAGLYLLSRSRNSKVSLFEPECEHGHNKKEAQSGLLSEL